MNSTATHYIVRPFSRDSYDGTMTNHYWRVETDEGTGDRLFEKTESGFECAHAWAEWMNAKSNRKDGEFLSGSFTAPGYWVSSQSRGYWHPERVDEYFILGNGIEVHWYRYTSYGDKQAIGKTGLVYASGYEELSMDGLEYTIRGEDPEMDKKWDRYNRQEVSNMRDVFQEVVDHPDFDRLPIQVQEVLIGKLPFSRKAGCSCGCSPAFKTKNDIGIGGTIHVSK